MFIWREFPTTMDECFRSPVDGAIYAREIDALRVKGRITTFDWDRGEPVHTFWDLGAPDNTFVWYVQFVGREVHLIDCMAGMRGDAHRACGCHAGPRVSVRLALPATRRDAD